MHVSRNGKHIRSIVTDYKKIYHSRTIRDLIENGSINVNKSNLIKYITNAYDSNDKLKFSINLTYIDELAEKYSMIYIISGSDSIDDKIKDCNLSIVKNISKNITNTDKREIIYREFAVYEKKVSYKEFIKSIKEISLI